MGGVGVGCVAPDRMAILDYRIVVFQAIGFARSCGGASIPGGREHSRSIMLFPVLVGIGLTIVTVVVHALGTIFWVNRLRNRFSVVDSLIAWNKRIPFVLEMTIFAWTSVVLVVSHVIEVLIWAVTFHYLPDVMVGGTFEDAVYFSMVTFTSLGYGDVVIVHPEWRLLGGIQAMAGALVFGWSSALLFAGLTRMLSRGGSITAAESIPIDPGDLVDQLAEDDSRSSHADGSEHL